MVKMQQLVRCTCLEVMGAGTGPCVICLDDSFHEFMNEPAARNQPTNFRPPAAKGPRCWKNWESAACVDWVAFLDRLQAKLESEVQASKGQEKKFFGLF